MLVGSCSYHGFTYQLRGYDFGDAIIMKLSSPITKGIKEIDRGVYIVNEDGEVDNRYAKWEDLCFSVGVGSVKVDQYVVVEDGKKFKSQLNEDFFKQLGGILRGMKSGCRSDILVSSDALFAEGFNPMKIQTYEYDEGNSISLELDIIREIHYNGELDECITSLDLEDDYSYSEQIFSECKSNLKIKLELPSFTLYNIHDSDDDWDFTDDEDKIFSLAEIIERNPDKDYVWLKERKYEVVKDIERVQQVCKYIWQHEGIVAFDTETTGLKVNIKSREGKADRLVGMVFAVKSGEAFYFPVCHKKVENICTAKNEQFIIEKYFKPILEKKPLLCHNGAYDWKVMYNYGFSINLVHDTYILFRVSLWNDHTNLKLGLKQLTKKFLNRDSFELSDFVQGRFDSDKVKFWDLEEESVKYYACPDTDNDLDLLNYALQAGYLDQYEAKKTYEIEVLFSIVIAYQEYWGHCVDIDKIDSLVEAIQRDKEESYEILKEIAGREFNPKSSPDMQDVCFNILKLPVVELTDAGNPSTGKDTRKRWLSDSQVSDKNKKFVKALNTYLDARTLESNFTKNIEKLATPDGLMFSTVQQFLATGRVSTSDPNYQGYSDTVKKYIVPRNGYWAMDADYSSVEARIMCSMAGCKRMVEKLNDPDADYHRLKASDMFNVPYELVTDSLRKASKGVNFGILYGLGDENLGKTLRGTISRENTQYAKKMKKLYYKGMEELEDFIEVSKAQGRENNFSTTFFKRRRYYDRRTTNLKRIERQSCNARIQGTAADIYKLAMVRLFVEIKNRGWLGKVLISGFIHDEGFLEVHKSINPIVMLSVLRKAMMLEIKDWCTLFIGVGYGRTWYEAKKTEIPVQVQESLVNQYGEKGIEWWDGDMNKFCEWVVNEISNYKRDRVLNYLKNENNWGKVFAPTENELCHEVLKDINKGLKVEGATKDKCTITEDMLEDLKEFCVVFDCVDLYDKANVQKPVMQSGEEQEDDEEEDDFEYEEQDPREVLAMRVKKMGCHYVSSGDLKGIYFDHVDSTSVLKLVKSTIAKYSGDIPVYAIKGGEIFDTGLMSSTKVYPQLLKLYISSRNILGGV